MKTLLVLAAAFSLTAGAGESDCGDRLSAKAPLRPTEFHFQVLGPPQAPPLVLIHGLGGSSQDFDNILPALARKYRVIAYDQRGHGRTANKGSDYSLDVMASDLAALLDHLNLQRVHILGLSFGARTAMQFAHSHPERVLSLLVEDMEMIPRLVDYQQEYLQKAALSKDLPRFFMSLASAYNALRAFYSKGEAKDTLSSAIKHPNGVIELRHRPHGMFLFDLGGNGVDLTEQLQQFRGPLLFVRADPEFSQLTAAGVDHLRRTRPDVRVITVDDSAHVVHGTHPKTFLKIAEEFFDRAAAAY